MNIKIQILAPSAASAAKLVQRLHPDLMTGIPDDLGPATPIDAKRFQALFRARLLARRARRLSTKR